MPGTTAVSNGGYHHNGQVYPKLSADTSDSSIPSEATRVLNLLVNNPKLAMPQIVKESASKVVFTPDVEPFMPTSLKMSETASALWACLGLFADAICRERFGIDEPKKVGVDVYSATLSLFSVFLFQVDGKPFVEGPLAPRIAHLNKASMHETYRNVLSNIFKARDGRYFHLHGSLDATPILDMLNLPQHRLDLEGTEHIEASKDIYRAAVAARDSHSLEVEVNYRWRMPGMTCLTVDEYAATPHGKLQVEDPLYKLYSTHEQLPPVAWPRFRASGQSLSGVKVLDLTKVIAGPTVTRVLAVMGADVLRVSTKTQPEPTIFLPDCQLGKRDTEINLKTAEGKLKLDQLLEEADTVVDSYRAGVLDRLGFSRNWIHEIARRRGKGIVYCRENCYGWSGEWSARAGYQQISDCATGASWEQGKFLGLNEPVMPLLPNSDTQTGLTGAIAIMHALLRRSSEGGSYNVDVALNQYNNFLLREVGLHSARTQASIRALHPDFHLRHDTGIFEMAPMLISTTQKSNGVGPGKLWDPARFTQGTIRWGVEGEQAQYLDWRRVVSVEGESGKKDVVFDFDSPSCAPGSDEAKWLPDA